MVVSIIIAKYRYSLKWTEIVGFLRMFKPDVKQFKNSKFILLLKFIFESRLIKYQTSDIICLEITMKL